MFPGCKTVASFQHFAGGVENFVQCEKKTLNLHIAARDVEFFGHTAASNAVTTCDPIAPRPEWQARPEVKASPGPERELHPFVETVL